MKKRSGRYCELTLGVAACAWFLGPLGALSTIDVTVLFTPLLFRILFFKSSRNSSMSAVETSVTMSNSPVTSYSSSTLGSLDRARTTSSRVGDSTKMSTKARRRGKFNHRSWTPPVVSRNRRNRRPRFRHYSSIRPTSEEESISSVLESTCEVGLSPYLNLSSQRQTLYFSRETASLENLGVGSRRMKRSEDAELSHRQVPGRFRAEAWRLQSNRRCMVQ